MQSGDVSELFGTIEDDSLKSQAASDDSGEIDLEATLREVQSLGNIYHQLYCVMCMQCSIIRI